MIENTAAVNELARSAEVVKTGADIGIFAEPPSFELFIPTIHLQQILFPHSHIAADDAALAGIPLDDGERKSKTLGDPAHLAGQGQPEGRHFLPGCKSRRSGRVEIAAASLNPKAGFGKTRVVFHVAGVGNAIGIGQDQVVALGLGEASVENHVFTESPVLMPDVAGRAGE